MCIWWYSVLQNILQSRVLKKIAKSTVPQALVRISHQHVTIVTSEHVAARCSRCQWLMSRLSLVCPSIHLSIHPPNLQLFCSASSYLTYSLALVLVRRLGSASIRVIVSVSELSKLAANIHLFCPLRRVQKVCAPVLFLSSGIGDLTVIPMESENFIDCSLWAASKHRNLGSSHVLFKTPMDHSFAHF